MDIIPQALPNQIESSRDNDVREEIKEIRETTKLALCKLNDEIIKLSEENRNGREEVKKFKESIQSNEREDGWLGTGITQCTR